MPSVFKKKIFCALTILASFNLAIVNAETDSVLIKNIKAASAQKNLEDGSIFFHNGKAFCKYNLEDHYCRAGWSFFIEGLPYLQDAYSKDSTNAEICFKLGMTYYASDNKYRAIRYIRKAYEINPKIDPAILFYTARLEHLDQNWDKAIELYSTLLNKKQIVSDTKENVSTKDVKQWIEECENAKRVKKHADVSLVPMGNTINTPFPEYGSAILANGQSLLFSSKRDSIETDWNFVVYEEESEKIESIYLSYKNSQGWSNSIKLKEPVNSPETSSAIITVTSDNKEILLKKKGDIYRSAFINGTWDDPEAIEGDLNSNAEETSASFSATEDSIYFTSNRKGGLGNSDIYVGTLNKNKQVESITNLGNPINTEYNEDAVFYHKRSKTLFFSSDRPGTIGRHDIFFSKKQPDGTWTTPENVGIPINSPEDDLFFSINETFTKGFITSYRQNTSGEKDIYEITALASFADLFLIKEEEKRNIAATASIGPPSPKEDSVRIIISTQFESTAAMLLSYHIASENLNQTGESIMNKFSVNVPKRSFYTVTANMPGYFEFEKKIFFSDSSNDFQVHIELEKQKSDPVILSESSQEIDSIIFEGYVIDAETGKQAPATIQLFDSTTNELLGNITADRSGKYRLTAPKKSNYRIAVSSESHIQQSSYIAIPESRNTVIIKNKVLKTDNPILSAMKGKEDMEVMFETQKELAIKLPDNAPDTILVEIRDNESGTTITRKIIDRYPKLAMKEGKKYTITVKAEGFATTQYNLVIPKSAAGAILAPELKKPNSKPTNSYLGTILFTSNSNEIDAQYFPILESAKKILATDNATTLTFVGHTDEVGSEKSNLLLSKHRAQSCKTFASSHMDIALKKIIIDYKGESKPVADNSTESGRAQNRRVDVYICY